MTDQRQDFAGIPMDLLVRQANLNIMAVHAMRDAPEDTALNTWLMQAQEDLTPNTWLMRESTGRDYSLADCGPDAPINDQHEPLTELSPEVWEGILIGLCVLGVVTLWALIHYTPIFHTGHFPHVALWEF